MSSSRKRGHQHHPQNVGARQPNVPATEIIAALRDGKNLNNLLFAQSATTTTTDSNGNQMMNHRGSDPGGTRISQPEAASHRKHKTNDDNGNRLEVSQEFSKSPPGERKASALQPCDTSGESNKLAELDERSSLTKKSSSKKKTPSDKSDKSDKSEKSRKSSKNPDGTKKKRVKVASGDMMKMVRPAAEGACDDFNEEQDSEAQEWSKLRCTSERTEVIAERENRRQKRCADYPGLAFGRSIFSSDSVMKFNIIRNELHNIMNTQLKRVRCLDELLVVTMMGLSEIVGANGDHLRYHTGYFL